MQYGKQVSAGVLTTLCLVLVGSAVNANEDRKLDFFESRIRPVLIEHCYSCHSSTNGTVKGGLNLDSAGGWVRGGDSGPTIEAGNPDASLLIEALRYEGLEMPPAKKLPSAVIRDFETWIRDGAVDPRTENHQAPANSTLGVQSAKDLWSFQSLKKNAVPGSDQSLNRAIDAFVQRKLAAAELIPNQRAAASTLARRLYVDLTGLIPTPAQLGPAITLIQQNRIDQLVDDLLQSPQFGVHWGRHWLDVARYADSNGGDFNATFHNAWRYRDYVVNSMNADKPFNQFVVEQIAGDLLPFATNEQRSEQLIASGFLMIGAKMLSERDKEKLRMDVVDEQINTVGSAFLGLTLGCARCHDHKFDPIATTDYYALAGIFRSTRTLDGESQKYVSSWKTTPLPVSDSQVAAVTAWKKRQSALKTQLASAEQQLEVLQSMTEVKNRFIVDDSVAKQTGQWKSSKLTPRYVGSGYVHDDQSGKGEKSVIFEWTPPDAGEYEVRISYTHGSTRAANVPVEIVQGTFRSKVEVNQQKQPEHQQLFTTIGKYTFTEQDTVSVTIGTLNTSGYVIVDAVQFVPLEASFANRMNTNSQNDGIQTKIEMQRQELDKLKQKLKKLQQDAPAPLPEAFAARDRETAEDCHVCIRGEHRNRGKLVPRGFISALSTESSFDLPQNQSGRLEFAKWIASPQNPLTGRVIVNRVWSHLFGEGIVRTVDNFGRLSDKPSHPELLDHLAGRFVQAMPDESTTEPGKGLGWSIKSLIREIVLSETYQRSCDYHERSYSIDAENRLLWRAHRRTLTAESLRDSILLISGQLDLSSSESPVSGFGTLVKSNDANAGKVVLAETNRRSLYLPIIRNELPTILTAFDFAEPDLVVGKRSVTNVPAQALFLLNSDFVRLAADRTATALCREHSDIHELTSAIYRRILSRDPSADEVEEAVQFLTETQGSNDTQQRLSVEINMARVSRLIRAMFASTAFRMMD